MNAFEWNRHFETGLDLVDKQHRHLIDLVNKLGALITTNRLEYDHIKLILGELIKYTEYHFKEEQSLMSSFKLDKSYIARHILAHQSFIKEIRYLSGSIHPHKEDEFKLLFDYLMHWLAYHILGVDQEMARQISIIKTGSTPEEAYEIEKNRESNATEPLLIALKGLFDQVSKQNLTLVNLNRDLEEKVEERTVELSRLNSHLTNLSYRDQLTGLYNRRYAIEQMSELWNLSYQNDLDLCCMMVDADNFKTVNDTYGHKSGDMVIQELALCLKDSLKEPNIVCRLGGDEFIIICPETNIKRCKELANYIMDRVRKMSVLVGSGVWAGSVSIGLSEKRSTTFDYETLIKVADMNVYEAKRAGKNCIRHKIKG